MKLVIGLLSLFFFSFLVYKNYETCSPNHSTCCPRRVPQLFPRYNEITLASGQYIYNPIPFGSNFTTDVECCSTANSKCDILYIKDQRSFDLFSRGSNDTNLFFMDVSRFNVRCQNVLLDWKVPSHQGSRVIFFVVRSPSTVRENFRVIMNTKISR